MAYALDNRGGGQALPPYLQGRMPMANTQPMITPKSTVSPGEAGQPKPFTPQMPSGPPTLTPAGAMSGGSGASAPNSPTTPGSPVTPGPQTLYDFLKHDLENKRKDALSAADADASARGVFYGTPLTTSHGDIQTEFLRGLGQLQANVLQNEQGNELQRLGLASGLLNQAPQSTAGGIDPNTLQQLGALFGGSTAASGARSGPTITPKKQGIDNTSIKDYA